MPIKAIGLILFVLCFVGCRALDTPLPTVAPLTTAVPLATAQAVPTTIVSSPTAVFLEPIDIAPTETAVPADSGWQLLRAGLEQRTINLYHEGSGQQLEQLFLLRLQPEEFAISVAYAPEAPKSLAAWQAETDALLVVNGGFFTETWQATGLTIVDGVASGVSYTDFGGMLTVSETNIGVRSLVEQPFAPSEELLYALQSFPMLVLPNGRLGFPEEDGRPNRRTAVGMDQNGRLLFIVAPWGSFTLHQLSRYLVESDLMLETVLNLDGGTSTGLYLATPTIEIPTFTPLPTVIVVKDKLDDG